MIADLFEPHERGEDDPAALHADGALRSVSQLLHRLLIEGELLRARVLDGLSLVEDDDVPRSGGQARDSLQAAVGRNDDVALRERLRSQGTKLRRRDLRWMSDEDSETRSETRDLGAPVRDQRRRDDQQAGVV